MKGRRQKFCMYQGHRYLEAEQRNAVHAYVCTSLAKFRPWMDNIRRFSPCNGHIPHFVMYFDANAMAVLSAAAGVSSDTSKSCAHGRRGGDGVRRRVTIQADEANHRSRSLRRAHTHDSDVQKPKTG